MEFELYYRDDGPHSVVGVSKHALAAVHVKLDEAGYVPLGRYSDFPLIRVYSEETVWSGSAETISCVDFPTIIGTGTSDDADVDDDYGEDDDEDYDEDDADGIPARDVAWEGLGRVLSTAGELATHHEPYYHDSLLTMVGTLLDEANGLFRDLQELE